MSEDAPNPSGQQEEHQSLPSSTPSFQQYLSPVDYQQPTTSAASLNAILRGPSQPEPFLTDGEAEAPAAVRIEEQQQQQPEGEPYASRMQAHRLEAGEGESSSQRHPSHLKRHRLQRAWEEQPRGLTPNSTCVQWPHAQPEAAAVVSAAEPGPASGWQHLQIRQHPLGQTSMALGVPAVFQGPAQLVQSSWHGSAEPELSISGTLLHTGFPMLQQPSLYPQHSMQHSLLLQQQHQPQTLHLQQQQQDSLQQCQHERLLFMQQQQKQWQQRQRWQAADVYSDGEGHFSHGHGNMPSQPAPGGLLPAAPMSAGAMLAAAAGAAASGLGEVATNNGQMAGPESTQVQGLGPYGGHRCGDGGGDGQGHPNATCHNSGPSSSFMPAAGSDIQCQLPYVMHQHLPLPQPMQPNPRAPLLRSLSQAALLQPAYQQPQSQQPQAELRHQTSPQQLFLQQQHQHQQQHQQQSVQQQYESWCEAICNLLSEGKRKDQSQQVGKLLLHLTNTRPPELQLPTHWRNPEEDRPVFFVTRGYPEGSRTNPGTAQYNR